MTDRSDPGGGAGAAPSRVEHVEAQMRLWLIDNAGHYHEDDVEDVVKDWANQLAEARSAGGPPVPARPQPVEVCEHSYVGDGNDPERKSWCAWCGADHPDNPKPAGRPGEEP